MLLSFLSSLCIFVLLRQLAREILKVP
jgi:hypothetical protein